MTAKLPITVQFRARFAHGKTAATGLPVTIATALVLFALLPLVGSKGNEALARERESMPVRQAPQTDGKPFDLPFASVPGPDTWLLAQPYGNSTGAYRQRNTTYRAGQGIHFGVDFTAPCGTEIVAMADGVVFAADAMSFGSAPHNLMVDHPDLGYSTFYGHLLERPALASGQAVARGQVIALTGDPADTCNGRPHLHLEIRDLTHGRKYNPVELVNGDWNSFALVGSFGRGFERDLADPRKWQHLDDQPEICVGGPLINDFANPWPPDS